MTQAITDYIKLITSQYQNSSKFISWLTTPLQIAHDISVCADELPAAFDIDTAVGVQLDTIGIIIGQARTLSFQPSDGSSAYLDDATYRKVLKLKTLTNYWDGTQDKIYSAWYAVFPDIDLLITDNQDMTCDVIITGSLTQIVIDMIHHDLIIPRPEGVEYNYSGTVGTLPLFAYDMDTQYFKGYDEGYWDSTLA
jgi:hypothetical protein